MRFAVRAGAIAIAGLIVATSAHAEVLTGLTSTGQLRMVRTENLSRISDVVIITGLESGEFIMGMDYRPANGLLYGLGSTYRLYIIDPGTGEATSVGGGTPIAFSPADFTKCAFDFNPVADRIRVITQAGASYRVNPDTAGLTSTDASIDYVAGDPSQLANADITAVAYTNNFVGSTSTTLLGFDSTQGTVVLIGSRGGSPSSPNTGLTSTLSSLVGTTWLDGFVGMDASGASSGIYLTIPSGPASTSLYKVDEITGAGTFLGVIPAQLNSLSVNPPVPEERCFALAGGNQVVSFKSNTPGLVDDILPITGLPGGVNLRGLDQRPANGRFYSYGSDGILYKFGRDGVATPVGTAIPELVGNINTGLDFNPGADRLRVVTSTGTNLRVHPDTGVVVSTDPAIGYDASDPNAGLTPSIISAAYSNNRNGATATTLYVLDATNDKLATLGNVNGTPISPNTGKLFTVAAADFSVAGDPGFDISGSSGLAYVLAPRGDLPRGAAPAYLHRIDLATGASVAIGAVQNGMIIRGFCIDTAPNFDPDIVFTNLNSTQWTTLTVNPPYSPPAFGEVGGLQMSVNGVPTNTFGLWQTAQALAPLPKGKYRAHFSFAPIGEVDGARLPEIRVRLFNFNNTQSRFAVVADTVPADPAPRSADVYWESDGITPWRAGLDILSFLPEIQGGYTFTGISFTPES